MRFLSNNGLRRQKALIKSLTVYSDTYFFRRLGCLICLFLLYGCTWFQFPGVYRLDIQQGNIITQEMVDQLKPGMTKRQVNFVLGTPLVQDSFRQDRWDYFYSLRNSKGVQSNKRFTVYFKDDQLSHAEGDYEVWRDTDPQGNANEQSAAL